MRTFVAKMSQLNLPPPPLGWHLLLSTLNDTEGKIDTCSDLLLAYTHLVLLHHGFQCIGTVEKATDPTENLPKLWKTSFILYEHAHSVEHFQLFHFRLDDGSDLLLNFRRLNRSNDTNALFLKTGTFVHPDQKIADHDKLAQAIRKNLIDSFQLG